MSKKSERREFARQNRRAARLAAQSELPADTPPIIPSPKTAAAPTHPNSPPEPTISEAQLAANRANAQLSTGPVTEEGRAIVAQNRRTHGLTGAFKILPWENAEEFQNLAAGFHADLAPQDTAEFRLVADIIQHYWLKERAVKLQERLIENAADPTEVDGKKLALFLRYQTTHERSYYKAERALKTLRKERRVEQIGFESQKRKTEAHEARTRLSNARAQNLEIDTACRQVMEVPAPGNQRLTFDELTKACSTGIATAVYFKERAAAA